MTLSNVLTVYRKAQGLSVRQFAKVIGCDHSTLWRFLQGRPCDDKTLVGIQLWLLDGNAPLKKRTQ